MRNTRSRSGYTGADEPAPGCAFDAAPRAALCRTSLECSTMPATERRTEKRRHADDEEEESGEGRPSRGRTPREIALARSRSPWDRAKRWVRQRVLRVA